MGLFNTVKGWFGGSDVTEVVTSVAEGVVRAELEKFASELREKAVQESLVLVREQLAGVPGSEVVVQQVENVVRERLDAKLKELETTFVDKVLEKVRTYL